MPTLEEYLQRYNVKSMFDNITNSDILQSKNLIRTMTMFKAFTRYSTVANATNVPAVVIGLIHYRESDFDFSCHLHNGDPIYKNGTPIATKNVPAGRGPFSCWADSATDALMMDSWRPDTWSLESTAYFLEKYNGFGYFNKGVTSPYLWNGSSNHQAGKYTSDGVYDPTAVDDQCGTMVMLKGVYYWNALNTDYLYQMPSIKVADAQAALSSILKYMPSLPADGYSGANTLAVCDELKRQLSRR